MSRQNFCYFDDPYVGDAHRAVARLVACFRSAGHKNEHAIELAAQALDLSPRRAWALRYLTQPVRVLRAQRDLLLHRTWSHMDRLAADLRAQADEFERQAEAERLAEAQLQLPLLGAGLCSEHFMPRSSSGDGGAHGGAAMQAGPGVAATSTRGCG